jgi:hypothetical protein
VGARFNRLLEYADALHECFPSSMIVIIGSWAEFVWRSQSHLVRTVPGSLSARRRSYSHTYRQNTVMKPVVELLQSEWDHSTRFRGVLVHIISNGSCLILILAMIVFTYTPVRRRLAVHDAS